MPHPELGQVRSDTPASDDAGNRDVMWWWYGICQQARDATLRFAAYDVIRGTSGWGDVKCGNYDDLNADGKLDSTGWFTDRGDTGNYNKNDPVHTYSTRSWNILPRGDAERAWGGSLFYLHPDTSGNVRRWWGLEKKSSGQVDCPVLYELTTRGIEGDTWRPGFNQKNVFTGNDETAWESVMRVCRHSVESAINSKIASDPSASTNLGGLHQSRLAPWVQMPGTSFVTDSTGHTPFPGCRLTSDIAQVVAMLRAKDVREIQWFHDNAAFPDNPELGVHAPEAWRETAQVLHQVYATNVWDYRTTLLTSESHHSSTSDLNKLEFTLRVPNTTNTVQTDSVVSAANTMLGDYGENGPEGEWGSSMTVDFAWAAGDWTTPSSEYTGPTTKVHVNFEYATSRADTSTTIFMWHWGTGTTPGYWTGTYPYSTYAPVANGMYHNRIGFDFDFASDIINPASGSTPPLTRVKLVLTNGLGAFTTIADLTQLYPVSFPIEVFFLEREFSVADLNFDGVVDDLDLWLFTGSWISGESFADMNMNNSVDLDDLDTFLNAM